MILAQEEIRFGTTNYNIFLSESFQGLSKEIAKLETISKLFILTEKKIFKLHGKAFSKELKLLDIPYSFIFIKGKEKNKHIDSLKQIYNTLILSHIDRKSAIVALGGGVVGDLTGFVAATMLRGLRFIQVPTTLLACVDSSVGGKVAVNVDRGKNMVGAFHQPDLVFAPIHTLYTLPKKEWRCGVAEVLKHSLLRGGGFFDRIIQSSTDAIMEDKHLLQYCITESVRYKAEIVAEDEKETGKRAVLNLGHTLGHAIESCTQYKKYSHGEAVGIGLLLALSLSYHKFGLDQTVLTQTLAFMKRSKFKLSDPTSPKKLLEHIKHDKKNQNGKIRFSLLRTLGDPVWNVEIEEKLILSLLKKQSRL